MTPEPRNTIDDATHDEWVAVSQNMKMEISKEWCEKSAKIEGDAAVGAGLPSALGLPKIAAPSGALVLATGSLPASSEWVRCAAEEIAERSWQEMQRGLYHLTTDAVEEILLRHAARETVRQPEENARHEP